LDSIVPETVDDISGMSAQPWTERGALPTGGIEVDEDQLPVTTDHHILGGEVTMNESDALQVVPHLGQTGGQRANHTCIATGGRPVNGSEQGGPGNPLHDLSGPRTRHQCLNSTVNHIEAPNTLRQTRHSLHGLK
jgi:hypothetical protein